MNMNNNVYDAAKILIQISKDAQEARPDLKESMGLTVWLREYCTVRVGSARRTGHTTAIERLIKENNMKLGVIVSNETQKNMFRADSSFISNRKNYEDFILGRNLKELDGIAIDTSFLLSQKQKDGLYRIIAPAITEREEPFFIILLQ